MTVHELIIIGSDPAGYAAAIYTACTVLNPIVFEGALDSDDALINTTEVENFPGFPDGMMGPDLMGRIHSQTERSGVQLVTGDAEAVGLTDEVKKVTDSVNKIWEVKIVILTMGSGYRKLGANGKDRLSSRGVSQCAICDGTFLRDKPIAVIGDGDSAVEEATFLTRLTPHIVLVHRRDELHAPKVMASCAGKGPKLDFVQNSVMESINGDTRVEFVILRNTVTGKIRRLKAFGMFVAIGHDPCSALVKGQVELDEAGCVRVAAGSQAANLQSVLICDGLVDHTYHQTIMAAGSGCRAALDAEHWLVTNETQS